MRLLNAVWEVQGQTAAGQSLHSCIQSELLLCLCSVLFLHMDLRAKTDHLITCSDASDEGAGGCRALSLTPPGVAFLQAPLQQSIPLAINKIMLVECFGGIAGARRAFEVLGVPVACHVHIDLAADAPAVTKLAWPEVVCFGDIELVGKRELEALHQELPDIASIYNTGGARCQDVSGLNAARWRPRAPVQIGVPYRAHYSAVARGVRRRPGVPDGRERGLHGRNRSTGL